ncbi:MAG: hypothetical protein LUQ45_03925, partial [Methanoregulaceae archaeon]|nr:hypothetical protein [Methanoregulaceae archaeon]
ARVGGYKFAALLPLSDEAIGNNAIARLRIALADQSKEYRDPPLVLSFGVATGQKGCYLYDILKQAEARMSK